MTTADLASAMAHHAARHAKGGDFAAWVHPDDYDDLFRETTVQVFGDRHSAPCAFIERWERETPNAFFGYCKYELRRNPYIQRGVPVFQRNAEPFAITERIK